MTASINRRTCLKGLACGAAAAAFGGGSRSHLWAAESTGSQATIDILLDEQIRDAAGKPAVISPLLHGHFTEPNLFGAHARVREVLPAFWGPLRGGFRSLRSPNTEKIPS